MKFLLSVVFDTWNFMFLCQRYNNYECFLKQGCSKYHKASGMPFGIPQTTLLRQSSAEQKLSSNLLNIFNSYPSQIHSKLLTMFTGTSQAAVKVMPIADGKLCSYLLAKYLLECHCYYAK